MFTCFMTKSIRKYLLRVNLVFCIFVLKDPSPIRLLGTLTKINAVVIFDFEGLTVNNYWF